MPHPVIPVKVIIPHNHYRGGALPSLDAVSNALFTACLTYRSYLCLHSLFLPLPPSPSLPSVTKMEKEIGEDEDENQDLSRESFDLYQERRLQYLMKREEDFRSDMRRREEAFSDEMRRMQEEMRRRENNYYDEMRRRENTFMEDLRMERQSMSEERARRDDVWNQLRRARKLWNYIYIFDHLQISPIHPLNS